MLEHCFQRKLFCFLGLRYHLRYLSSEGSCVFLFFWKAHSYYHRNIKSKPPSADLFQSKNHILSHLPKDSYCEKILGAGSILYHPNKGVKNVEELLKVTAIHFKITIKVLVILFSVNGACVNACLEWAKNRHRGTTPALLVQAELPVPQSPQYFLNCRFRHEN